MGRALICDPYWPTKVKEGRIEDICPCIWDKRCIEDVVGRFFTDVLYRKSYRRQREGVPGETAAGYKEEKGLGFGWRSGWYAGSNNRCAKRVTKLPYGKKVMRSAGS